MLCRDVKEKLRAQRDGTLEPSQIRALQKHLKECATCHALEQQERHLASVPGSLKTEAPVVHNASISTEQIMRAVQQKKQVTEQLKNIQQQQQTRIARMGRAGAVGVALSFLVLSSIPLLFLLLMIIQTDLVLKTLTLLNGAIDTGIILGQYLQSELTFITRNSLLLSGLAFVVVVMMGMWLRLMRSPHEA